MLTARQILWLRVPSLSSALVTLFFDIVRRLTWARPYASYREMFKVMASTVLGKADVRV